MRRATACTITAMVSLAGCYVAQHGLRSIATSYRRDSLTTCDPVQLRANNHMTHLFTSQAPYLNATAFINLKPALQSDSTPLPCILSIQPSDIKSLRNFAKLSNLQYPNTDNSTHLKAQKLSQGTSALAEVVDDAHRPRCIQTSAICHQTHVTSPSKSISLAPQSSPLLYQQHQKLATFYPSTPPNSPYVLTSFWTKSGTEMDEIGRSKGGVLTGINHCFDDVKAVLSGCVNEVILWLNEMEKVANISQQIAQNIEIKSAEIIRFLTLVIPIVTSELSHEILSFLYVITPDKTVLNDAYLASKEAADISPFSTTTDTPQSAVQLPHRQSITLSLPPLPPSPFDWIKRKYQELKSSFSKEDIKRIRELVEELVNRFGPSSSTPEKVAAVMCAGRAMGAPKQSSELPSIGEEGQVHADETRVPESQEEEYLTGRVETTEEDGAVQHDIYDTQCKCNNDSPSVADPVFLSSDSGVAPTPANVPLSFSGYYAQNPGNDCTPSAVRVTTDTALSGTTQAGSYDGGYRARSRSESPESDGADSFAYATEVLTTPFGKLKYLAMTQDDKRYRCFVPDDEYRNIAELKLCSDDLHRVGGTKSLRVYYSPGQCAPDYDCVYILAPASTIPEHLRKLAKARGPTADDLTLAQQLKSKLAPLTFAKHCNDAGLLDDTEKVCPLFADSAEVSHYKHLIEQHKQEIGTQLPVNSDEDMRTSQGPQHSHYHA